MLLSIHIAAGGLALILGAVALSWKKGGTIHRRSGLLFVCAMLIMGATAAMLGNAGGGLMSAYFVMTAWMTVRPVSPWTRRINVGAMIFAIAFSVLTVASGVKAFNSSDLSPGGVPLRTIGAMSFFLAFIMTLAAIGDARLVRSGPPHGRARLARHLWRMCFALFIAAGSFFSIRERVARILPEPFTMGPMRLLPILLVFGTMFYWLWKLRRPRALPVLVRNDSVPT